MSPFSKWAAPLVGALLSFAVQADSNRPEDVGNPSPASGSDASMRANELADKAMYKPVEYRNAAMRGPHLVVIPGEIKSTNATFTQQFGPNNIADFAELEFGRANFGVLERSDMGPLLQEFQLAYTMGDPVAAGKILQKGKLKTTKWVVKLDILKAEPVATAQGGFDGRALGQLISIFGSTRSDTARRNSDAAGNILGSVKTDEGTGVWIIGMRFKILNAVTTEQVATGYTEEKMEIGAKTSSVLGFSQGAQGGLTLDGMVQRLVQKLVWDIDAKYKEAGAAPDPVPATRSVAATVPEQSVAPHPSPQTGLNPADPDPDSETWRMALRANTAPAYRAYLEAFPNGRYQAAARIALASTGQSAPEPERSAVPPAPTSVPTVAPPSREQHVEAQTRSISATSKTAPLPVISHEKTTVSATAAPHVVEKPAQSAAPPAPAVAASAETRQGLSGADILDTSSSLPACSASAQMSEWNDCTGVERDAQGATSYAGAYKNGIRHGQGSYYWPSGERYEGQFVEGRIEGQGARTWPNGEKYVGEFKDGRIDGRGTRTWANGEKYVGPFKDGNSDGQGVFTWPNGEKYSGQFKSGRFDGPGERSWANGEKYVGEFKNGTIEGRGTYFWPNGEKYVGQWRNGMRHGQGTQYNPAGGIIFQGNWDNNRKHIE